MSGGKQRLGVYVDGFNFYYGAVKGTDHKWLDFRLLAAELAGDDFEVAKVWYFTARVEDRFDNPGVKQRQKRYFDALDALPEVEVVPGVFKRRPKFEPIAGAWSAEVRMDVEVIRHEEKGSDVNLAVHLLRDAYERNYDAAMVISNDSDLERAVDFAEAAGLPVLIVNPTTARAGSRRKKSVLNSAAGERKIGNRLGRCHLPDSVRKPDGSGVRSPWA